MTRRLSLTLTLVVFAAVLLSTVLSLLVGQAGARRTSRDEVARIAVGLARRDTALGLPGRARPAPPFCSLGALGRAFGLEQVGCVAVAEDGTVRPLGGIPARTVGTPGRVDRAELERVAVLSGDQGRHVWALAPIDGLTGTGRDQAAVVVVRRVRNPVAGVGLSWLLISGAVTTVAGVVAAFIIGRRLSRPLQVATATARRIAAGDLTARVPLPDPRPGGDTDPPPADDDEVLALSRTLNELAASLERERGLEQRFLLSISHDLRTPLTSIRGYAEALADGTLTDVGRGAAVISEQSRRLERLVADLLDLARLDARAFRFDLRPVALADVARRAVDALGPDAASVGIELRVEPPAPAATPPAPAAPAAAPVVVADEHRLDQVVANLTENALRYATTAVVLRTSTSTGTGTGTGRDTGVLSVADDGPGISAEDLPHVFERLYVSRQVPVRREAGSGLGLAIVRELVEAMGGTVSAGPNHPRGTVMTVTLPSAAPPPPPAPPPTPSTPPPGPGAPPTA